MGSAIQPPAAMSAVKPALCAMIAARSSLPYMD